MALGTRAGGSRESVAPSGPAFLEPKPRSREVRLRPRGAPARWRSYLGKKVKEARAQKLRSLGARKTLNMQGRGVFQKSGAVRTQVLAVSRESEKFRRHRGQRSSEGTGVRELQKANCLGEACFRKGSLAKPSYARKERREHNSCEDRRVSLAELSAEEKRVQEKPESAATAAKSETNTQKKHDSEEPEMVLYRTIALGRLLANHACGEKAHWIVSRRPTWRPVRDRFAYANLSRSTAGDEKQGAARDASAVPKPLNLADPV